jgi:hypothetical protein
MMNKQQVAERLLQAINVRKWTAGAAFGGAQGAFGSINVLQSDVNEALRDWFEFNNKEGVQKIADTLHMIGSLNDADYEQIMLTIDGEN